MIAGNGLAVLAPQDMELYPIKVNVAPPTAYLIFLLLVEYLKVCMFVIHVTIENVVILIIYSWEVLMTTIKI